jgi:hypothetical protein
MAVRPAQVMRRLQARLGLRSRRTTTRTTNRPVEFMVKQVEPTMASLIGEKPYDEKTKLGFNCFRCHTT